MTPTFVPDIVSSMQWSYYDTYELAKNTATPTQIMAFTEEISATKSRSKTNLTSSKGLEAPKSFELHAIRCVFGPRVKHVDAAQMLEEYVLTLKVGDGEYAQGGIENFPGGAGLVRSTALDGASSAAEKTFFTNGVADPRAINVLSSPIMIGQGQKFWVELTGDTFTTSNDSDSTGMWLRIYLDGILYRGAQA